MSDQLSMFEVPNLLATPSATSLPGLESGATPCGGLGGKTIDQSGPGVAPAPPSARQVKAQGLETLVTSGLIGSDSLGSARLQQSLESRLVRRLDMAGSTLFKQTWKRRTTPLGRSYLEHTASGRRTSGKGFTSVPTPNAMEGGQTSRGGSRKGELLMGGIAQLATVPTPMAGTPAQNGNNAAGNNDYSRRIVELASVMTPTTEDHKSDGPKAMQEWEDALAERRMPRESAQRLRNQVAALSTVATPRSEDSQCAGSHRGVPDTLHSQANLASVKTPRENDWKGGLSPTGNRKRAQADYFLPDQVTMLCPLTTPSARDYKDTSGMSETGVDPDGSTRTRLDQLPRQAQLADSGLTATGGTAETAATGQLDPEYSRWLMGLPTEWSNCADTAMASLPRKRPSSSKRISKPEVSS